MNIEKYAKLESVRELLVSVDCSLSSDAIARINAHLALVVSHGSAFGVVSVGDIERGVLDHVVDSLSLIPYIRVGFKEGRCLVDVGSGGGFPGLVCAAAFPESDVVLIERSEKKCAFLRRSVAELGLRKVTVFGRPFDEYLWTETPVMATVRGLERAEEIVPHLVSGLAVGSSCLWMTGPKVEGQFDSRFHVEQIVDKWTSLGLRRGTLFSIEVRKPESADG